MAWTTPRTWVANEVLTASLLNTHIRDNFLETAPAKVTTAGDIVYGTGPNAIARLAQGSIAGGVGNPKFVVKGADESVTSSITPQNDDALFIALAANEIWIVECFVVAFSASATPDFRSTWTVPTGASGGFTLTHVNNGGTSTVEQGAAFTINVGSQIAASAYISLLYRVYVSNGANAGNLQFQWAQVNSDATAVTVKKGSLLRALKVG